MSEQQQVEMAEAVYEPRDYPDCPEGEYVAICAKAELRESRSQFDEPGAKRINLRWEIMKDNRTGQEVFYVDQTDPEKKKRHYMVFSKPLSQSFGERSNTYKLFKELTGLEIDCVLQKKKELRSFQGVQGQKEVTVIRFDQTIFEGMTAIVKVKHNEYEDKMGNTRIGVNVDSLDASVPVKWENYNVIRRLPGVGEFPEAFMKKLQSGGQETVDLAKEAPGVFDGQQPAPQANPAPSAPPAQPHGYPPAPTGGPVPVPHVIGVPMPNPAPTGAYPGQQVPAPHAVHPGGAAPAQQFRQPVPNAPAGYPQQPQYPGNPPSAAGQRAPSPQGQFPPSPQAPQFTPGLGGVDAQGRFISPQGTQVSDLPQEWQ